MPRRNTVGRTLGGRDKDKMTDCPMVLALKLECKIREVADTHTHLNPHQRTNAGTTMHTGNTWVVPGG